MLELREPKIVTELPGPKSKEMLKQRAENVPQGVSNIVPLYIKRGEGALFEDVDGNVFLDFAGGIGVLNIGYSHPEVVAAVKEQSDKFFHTSINVVLYEQYAKLAEKLNKLIPGDFKKKTMLVNSGAEAVENAIKIARKYTKRTEIITFTGAFHGRTLLTMTMTSKVKPYKWDFGPYAPGIRRMLFPYCYRCPHGLEKATCNLHCAKQFEAFFLEEVTPEDVAAIILEPIQGEGGFIIPPDEYIKALRKICDKHGILLIADEVQSSYCRTGRMFATEYWKELGVCPDIVATAKSIAGGLPISTVTGRAEVMDASHVGGIGGTYGGNPVAASAALKVIEIMERDYIAEKSLHIGKICMKRFEEMQEKYELVGDVRGRGAMVAIELVKDRGTKETAKEETNNIVQECWKNGLVVLSAGARGNVLRFLMPLVITDHQLNIGLDILENAIAKVSSDALAYNAT
ncbi:4-aminobutyrate aminotransferase / (S)-3-amino-2-methylpropionate transaminase [Anaerovirgula multivorans]|uniref:(S)-3-amino-2-methylpropionate transaminase n=1 Tax=Anaerovirgula multivorans TaxID=312168 RepID=A0A239FX83_9FIRM|nr:4-aminobutyrate--2-oxoglutarate transaminase [Anaerovirgula multivorans]SNS61355.1 4-aminobutyrate aminotransferase / (S)-3-amino-2-methylpropionate transaminase [Anaerovirgula multivorans]